MKSGALGILKPLDTNPKCAPQEATDAVSGAVMESSR